MPRPLALGPGWCLPGGRARDPARCSQADAARAATPPYAARAAQPLNRSLLGTLLGRLFPRSGPDRLAGLGAASCDSGLTAGWTVRPDPCWVNAAVSHRLSLETSASREANLVYLPVVEPAGLGWLL